MSVRVSVCLPVLEHISGTAGPIVTKFCVQNCRSYVAVAQSSSGGVALRYVLPVSWMTSHLAVMGRMALRGRPDLLVRAVSYVCDRGGVRCLWMPCYYLA